MYKSIVTAVGTACAVLLSIQPAHGATLFSDDMESGVGSWTASGLWHYQTDPQDVAISADINPDLVSLPDFGYLPNAYSGTGVWWYGSAADGTIMGDWTLENQTAKNGGESDLSNVGTLTSPSIDLTTAEDATLSFWHWWEVEGVDVDRYDLMTVLASTDGGTTWTTVATLNPTNDVDGESYKPYSSGGLGQVGQWLYSMVDLSAYVGNNVQLQFSFDTVDEKYNGFRGWLIDDVTVTNDNTVKPAFDSQTAQATASCGGDSAGEIDTPAQFYVQRAQQVQVTSDGNWYITPTGSEDYVASGTAGITSGVYLNAGFYTLWVNYTTEQACPNTVTDYATASFYGGAGQPSASFGTVVTFYGNDFVNASTVSFTGGPSASGIMAATEADAVVVSSTELQVTVPYLSDGTYNLKVLSPNGKTTVLENALLATSEIAPDITAVSPEELADATTTAITITGTGFVTGAVATVGGVPIDDLTVTDSEITGTVPAGGPSGYQNVVVINPDGQVAKYIGGAYITDTSSNGFALSGSALAAPHRVHGVTVSAIHRKNVNVSWNKVNNTESYIIEISRGGEVVKTVTTTKRHKVVKGLHSGKNYKVQVRALGTYLGGTLSKKVGFETL